MPQWNIGSTQSFISQLERESLKRLQSQDIHDSLPFFVRLISTSGFAGTFDPDLYLQSDQRSEPFTLWESENLQSTGGPTNEFPNFILDMPDDFPCKDWMETMLTDSTEFSSQHVNARPMADPTSPTTTTKEPWSGDDTEHATAYDPLFKVANEIVLRLISTISNKAPNSPIRLRPSVALTKRARDFFSARNLHRFIELYWSTWYTHWPVIHRPTFVHPNVPYTLVAAMALIGASYSVDPEDRRCAKLFCDPVEEMIFGDEYFGDSSSYSVLNAVCINRRLRALQAAHAICLCQYWEGDDRGKRRVRRHRYGQVVAVGVLPNVQARRRLTSPTDGSRIGFRQSHAC